jgi:hypothetical protein
LLTPLAHFRRSFFDLLQFVDESTLALSAVFLQVSIPISTSITQTILLKHNSILDFIGLTSCKAQVHRAHRMQTLVADVLCSKLSVSHLYFVTLSLDCLIVDLCAMNSVHQRPGKKGVENFSTLVETSSQISSIWQIGSNKLTNLL